VPERPCRAPAARSRNEAAGHPRCGSNDAGPRHSKATWPKWRTGIARTNSTLINTVTGLPGPGAVVLPVDVKVFP
jgi:hypothetical protein